MSHYLIISTSIDLVRIALDGIVYAISDGNYATIVLTDGEQRLVACQLGTIERLINEQQLKEQKESCFIRVGRFLIINRKYIHYINPTRQQLILADGQHPSHTLNASIETLRQLKELIEQDNTILT